MPGRILNAYNRVVILGQVKVLVSSDGIENIVKPFIADCCVGVQHFRICLCTSYCQDYAVGARLLMDFRYSSLSS